MDSVSLLAGRVGIHSSSYLFDYPDAGTTVDEIKEFTYQDDGGLGNFVFTVEDKHIGRH